MHSFSTLYSGEEIMSFFLLVRFRWEKTPKNQCVFRAWGIVGSSCTKKGRTQTQENVSRNGAENKNPHVIKFVLFMIVKLLIIISIHSNCQLTGRIRSCGAMVTGGNREALQHVQKYLQMSTKCIMQTGSATKQAGSSRKASEIYSRTRVQAKLSEIYWGWGAARLARVNYNLF